RQVAAHLIERQSAQAVVGPERDDEHAHVALKRPVEPLEPARGCVAGNARVHHLEVHAAVLETLLEEGRIRAAGRQAEAGGEAVAKRDDARTWGRWSRGRGSGCGRARGRGRGARGSWFVTLVAARRAAGERAGGKRGRQPDPHPLMLRGDERRACVVRCGASRAGLTPRPANASSMVKPARAAARAWRWQP